VDDREDLDELAGDVLARERHASPRSSVGAETRARAWLERDKRPMIYGMNARTKKILDEAMTLPESERALLVAKLDASLESDGTPEEVEKAWAEELERRAENVMSGRSEGLDPREVIAGIRAELAALKR
jgi:putative addiction module component (TIGR02574 family)